MLISPCVVIYRTGLSSGHYYGQTVNRAHVFFGFKTLSAGIWIILTSITSKCIVENARVVRKVPECVAFFGMSSIMHTPTYDMKTPPIRIGGSRVEDGPRLEGWYVGSPLS